METVLNSQLELIRSDLSVSNYKYFLLPVYSLKYLGDQDKLPKEATISEIIRHEDDLFGKLKSAFKLVEQQYPDLTGVFDIFPDYAVNQRTLFNILLKVNSLRLSSSEWEQFIDLLILRLSESEGKKGAELYSPSSLNQLGIELLRPQSGSFYDGTAGIGGTLIQASKYSKEHSGSLLLYGQEINRETWALAKLNLLLQGDIDVKFEHGDTLLDPAFTERKGIKKFDFIMMNFPFSMAIEYINILEEDRFNRFTYGVPPKRSADMAFIMHGLASLNDKGKAVMVVTNGVLFRAGAEQSIRQKMIAADVIEAVIALPSNFFESTSIPTNLLILNKEKSPDRRGKILFINAENEFKEDTHKRRVMETEHIEKIVTAYQEGYEIENFSRFISASEIENGDLQCGTYLKDKIVYSPSFGDVMIIRDQREDYSLNKATIGELASLYRGMNVSSKSVIEGQGEYKIIKLSDVQDGEINFEGLASVSLLRSNTKTDMYIVQEGDVIVSNRGTSIKIAVVPKNEGNIILSHNFIGIRCGKKIDPYYLKAYLDSPIGMYHLRSKQVGTNILTINPKDLKDVTVPVLDINEQFKIAEGFKQAEIDYKEKLLQIEEEKKVKLLELYERMGIKDSFKLKE